MRNLIGWVIAALCLCFAARGDEAGNGKPKSADELYREAWYQQNALRNFDAAVGQYRKILDDPAAGEETASRAALRLGECHEALGKPDLAAEQYRAVQRRFPNQAAAVKEAGEKLARLGQKPLDDKKMIPATVFVTALLADGPPDRLQFRAGDILLEYDGKPVTSITELQPWVRATAGRDKAPVYIRRRGEDRTLQVRGGPLGVVLDQSLEVGTPRQMNSDNYIALKSALGIGSEKERAHLLGRLAARRNLTDLEQAALLDAMLDDVRDSALRREIRRALVENRAFSTAARGHLSARLGAIPEEAERAEAVRDIFRFTPIFNAQRELKSGEGKLSAVYGRERWDGRWSVSGRSVDGTRREGILDGDTAQFGLRGGMNSEWPDDAGVVYRWSHFEDRATLRRPLQFRGTTFPQGQAVKEEITIQDIGAPPIPVRYRRIEIEVTGGGQHEEKSFDIFMIGKPLDLTDMSGKREKTWDFDVNIGVAIGDLSFHRFAFLAEGRAALSYQPVADLTFFAGYELEYFLLEGQGSRIENLRHGPFVGASYRW